MSRDRSTRRGRSTGRGLLIFLLVVLLVVVAADRIGVLVAERQIASRVQSSQHLDRRPSVAIGGFPFLTQVLANHYPSVRVAADDLTVGNSDRTVRLAALDARLRDVRTIDNFSGATADAASGTAMLSYQELSRALGVRLGYAGDGADGNGRVQTNTSVEVLGQTLTATASAEVTVSGDQLSFSAVRVGLPQTGIAVPQQLTDQFNAAFAGKLSLRGLPFHMQIQRLVPTAAGVRVTAVASNLTLS